MGEPPRYRQILARCLEVEDKALRDEILARYPDQAPMVRRLMEGLARRLATSVRYAGTAEERRTEKPLTRDQRRSRRARRLKQIEPEWLRARVGKIVREQWAYVRAQRRELQSALDQSPR